MLFDLNNLTGKQLNLINGVIQFYKNNGNNYMNFENPFQIQYILNFIEAKIDKCKYDNEQKIEDPLYYIKEPKKVINFINTNYIIYKVNIPKTITKFDLYTIARHYKSNKFIETNVLLIYNNILLKYDESPIDSISENDFIKVIDIRNYPDSSYYNSLQCINKNKTNYIFKFPSGNIQNLVLPTDIKISQLLKAFYLKNGFDSNSYKFIYNGEILSQNDETKFYHDILTTDIRNIIVKELECLPVNIPYTFGKVIIVNISYFDKNFKNWIFQIGLLNSINFIISKNESKFKREVEILIIGDLRIKRDDQRTLLSLGIKKDFNCIIDFKEKNKK